MLESARRSGEAIQFMIISSHVLCMTISSHVLCMIISSHKHTHDFLNRLTWLHALVISLSLSLSLESQSMSSNHGPFKMVHGRLPSAITALKVWPLKVRVAITLFERPWAKACA